MDRLLRMWKNEFLETVNAQQIAVELKPWMNHRDAN